MHSDLPLEKEFEQFYSETAADASGYVRCLCGNGQEAEDIVHEGYIAALCQWDRFEGYGSRKAWLIGILRNTFLSWHRRQKVRKTLSLRHAAEVAVRESEAIGDRELWEAVEQLGNHHREIVYLRFAGGLDYAEIADVLKIAKGTVRSRLHRALQELKERLANDQ